MKDIYILNSDKENRKHFQKEFSNYEKIIRQQASTYFDLELPKLNIYFERVEDFVKVEEEYAADDALFLIYPRSKKDFQNKYKKIISSSLAKITITLSWLSATYVDLNTKEQGWTNRNNFKTIILQTVLECFELEQYRRSLDYLSNYNNFYYVKAKRDKLSDFNTVLNSFENISYFEECLEKATYVAIDTEFFNIQDNVVNTNIKTYIRTLTVSMLVETYEAPKHTTFEFAIEAHKDYSNELRYNEYLQGVNQIKLLLFRLLTDKFKTLFLHNASADLHLLINFVKMSLFGVNCNIVDTITSHFVDNPHTPKGLKQIIIETDTIFYNYDKALEGSYAVDEFSFRQTSKSFKQEVKDEIARLDILPNLKNINVKWISLELGQLLTYNAVDSFVTLNLGMKYLHKEGLVNMFFQNQMQFITIPFLQVERNGLPINLEALDKGIAFCEKGIGEYQTKLHNLGILYYFAVKEHLKNNTVLKKDTNSKLFKYLVTDRGLTINDWQKYKPTQKYYQKLRNIAFENDLCKTIIQKLKGRLTEVIDDIKLPKFIKPFNFSSPKQKIKLFYDYLGLEDLLVYSDLDFHERVLWKLKKDNIQGYLLLKGIKDSKKFNNLYDEMVYFVNQSKINVHQYSRFERKTDENVLGNILKTFFDAPEKSKKGILYKIAHLVQSASKITKTKSTYLENYKKSAKITDRKTTTHSSFRHNVRTSRQSSGALNNGNGGGGGGINSQNVTDSKRLPKRYKHLAPYLSEIKKVVKFDHNVFSSNLEKDIDFKNKQFEFQSFNTVLNQNPNKRVMLEFDYSQIELYVIAMLGNVEYMLEVINEGRDLHSMTAALTLGISYREYMAMTKAAKGTTRHDSKTMNFTYSFLGSAHSARQYAAKVYGINKPLEFWQGLEDKFHRQYSEIRPFAYKSFKHVMNTGTINTITGHTRKIADEHKGDFNTILNLYKNDGEPFDVLRWIDTIPYSKRYTAKKILRKGVNTQVQGSANSYTALSVAMNFNYIKQNKGYISSVAEEFPLINSMPDSVLQHNVVHDAQYVSCYIKDIIPTIKTYNEVMTNQVKKYVDSRFAFDTNIPLRIGVSIGDSWYNMMDFDINAALNEEKLIVAP